MRLVGVKEISLLLSVKPSTLYQWAELGQIPYVKLNGCVRFDLEDIETWVRRCKKNPDRDYNCIQTVTRSPKKGVYKKYGAV